MHRPRIDIGSWGDIIQEGFIYDRKTFECAEKTDIKMCIRDRYLRQVLLLSLSIKEMEI